MKKYEYDGVEVFCHFTEEDFKDKDIIELVVSGTTEGDRIDDFWCQETYVVKNYDGVLTFYVYESDGAFRYSKVHKLLLVSGHSGATVVSCKNKPCIVL